MTGTTSEDVEDFTQVASDPSAFYASPEAIVADAGLTRSQRLRLLTEWAQDLVDRQVAANEGMSPEVPGTADVDAALLRKVNLAIETVEAGPDETPGLLTRVWRRIMA